MAYSSSVMNTEKDTVLSHRELSEAWSDMHTERVVDVNEEVPEDWTRVEDDFIGIYAVALSHISNEGPFAPQARMNDDRIYLTYILRNDVSSKLDLLKFLTSIESHKHLELPFVKAIEVSAFRLEPQDSGSYLVVDGEIVRSQKIQAVTTTLKMAVFAPKRGCIES
nr:sphingosine kinase A-like isoform 2 [Haemonchus contortus]